jgi:lysophospholipid acyltransferase (LPLAT)-like uncharacterized protein
VVVLVSRHRDGEYITQVIHRLGYGTVRGSTSRGGYRSLLEMARRGRAGQTLAITPDGPRGPRRETQPGAVLIAQRSGIPLVPLACAVSPCRRLSSWDRFVIPAPRARTVMGFGPPVRVPADLKGDSLVGEWSAQVTAAIDRTCAGAERELERWMERDDARA